MKPRYITHERKSLLRLINQGAAQARAAAKLAEEASILLDGTPAETKMRAAVESVRAAKSLFGDAFESIRENEIEMRCLSGENFDGGGEGEDE